MPLPDGLKRAALAPAEFLDELAGVVPHLAQLDAKDEAQLEAFGELWEGLNPPQPDAAEVAQPNGLPSLPPAVEASLRESDPSELLKQLADPSSKLRERLPVLGSLSRRFGVILLRRVASRLEADAESPATRPLTRSLASRAAAADRTVADLIKPAAETAVETAVETAPVRDPQRV